MTSAMLLTIGAGAGIALPGAQAAARIIKKALWTNAFYDTRFDVDEKGIETPYDGYVYVLYINSMRVTVAFTENGTYVAKGKVLDKTIFFHYVNRSEQGPKVQRLNQLPSKLSLTKMVERYRYQYGTVDTRLQHNRFDAIRIGTEMHGVIQYRGKSSLFSAPAGMASEEIYLSIAQGRPGARITIHNVSLDV